MSKFRYIYNSIAGELILTPAAEKFYKDNILEPFLSTNDKYLFYDDLSMEVSLLNIDEMREQYVAGNYRNYVDWDYSFDDFCLSSCIEVLKSFNNYSVDDIEEEFKKHDILKLYVM